MEKSVPGNSAEKNSVLNGFTQEAVRDVEQGLTGVAPPQEFDDRHHHKRRTWGNKIFDLAVWPTIAFGAVYALSVWGIQRASVSGHWMNSIYKELKKVLEAVYVPKTESHTWSNILISFGIGTLLMTPIKLLEDQRGKISKWLDTKMDTVHDDPLHYAKEPKQSWRSIFGGRITTFLCVLAVGLSVGQKRTERITDRAADIVKGWWKAVKPEATGQTLEKVDSWTKANAFELFYTTLCALGVYILSRIFARALNKREERAHAARSSASIALAKDTIVPHAAGVAQEPTIEPKQDNAVWQEKAPAKQLPQKAEGFIKSVHQGRTALIEQSVLG